MFRPTVRERSAFCSSLPMHSVSTPIPRSALGGRAVRTTLYASFPLALWLHSACGKPNRVMGGGRRVVWCVNFPDSLRVEGHLWLAVSWRSAIVVSSLPVHVFGGSLLLNPQWVTLICMCCFLLGSQFVLHMSGSVCCMNFSSKKSL